ncbi:aminotransferase class V-fold PLP-dependent enzyme [Frigidibacter albus]|uniref:Aminotransferase class V-fold PLP-dependent enzyme n=1 Tax=Frigidibacter albus TaxID=1465486 RepID=A0A6L8VJ40_9RHOB|nr:aminotransferase class V-fold PLP-dependent enzyme [Frigidibacter albus]MZQ90345.1 aminotransferase class V-fold PLP-dependent enzyme [Frigidibacter albus]NBE32157.1 aminotransferase class V-fold PLP-dependent enzyme [Frigidibacter albus]GGH58877.1 septum site-determining protein [Frigidibacter albus]
MSLAQGRPYLAIPGPSTMPDRVLNAMHRAAPNIYEGALVEMTRGIYPDLRRVADTAAHVAIYIANGHGAWEAANANMFSRGDKALVAATGRFGIGWADSARRVGVDVEVIDFGRASPADPARIAEALAADTGHAIRAVLVTHVDTATSVCNDIPAIRAAMDSVGHPALLAVDCIASLGCDEFHMDAWGVDVMVAASQKGLMVPPGLGFVWFSDKALAASERSDLVTPYWDWKPRAVGAEYYQFFCGTAPTHHLFGLRESLTMILDEEGLPHVWARHEVLARAVWAAFDAWGKGGDIALNIADPARRGHSVTAARIGGGGAGRLRKWLETEAGVTLGIGLGMALPTDPAYQDYLRVAHMGHVNAHMTLGVLATMEAGMRALGIPHGPGGVEAAAAVVAGA